MINQLHQLQQVLKFYGQQLDLIKLRVQRQAAVVANHREIAGQLNLELAMIQRQTDAPPTASELEHTNHLMKLTQVKISRNQDAWNEALEELQRCQQMLKAQMSKIDALEKVVDRQQTILDHERRVAEQHAADERYLNTNFS